MKDYAKNAKNWDTELIISHAVWLGLEYMVNGITTEELEEKKEILIKELKSRQKLLKNERS